MHVEVTLEHWDQAQRADQPRIHLCLVEEANQLQILVQSPPDPHRTYGRSIYLEARDNGALAILCYGKDDEEPLIIEIPEDGSPTIIT